MDMIAWSQDSLCEFLCAEITTAISVSWYIEESLSHVGCGSDTGERRCGLISLTEMQPVTQNNFLQYFLHKWFTTEET